MSSPNPVSTLSAKMKQLTIRRQENGRLTTDAEDCESRLALAMVCLLREEDTVSDLLAKRRRIRAMDGSTSYAETLMIASEYKNALNSIVASERDQEKVKKTIGGRTPLSCAAEGGNAKIVRMLLENGEDVNETDADGSRFVPLHWAAYDENLEALELLLKHQANLEAVNADGHTPLALAAQTYQVAAVNLLLEKYNPNVNPIDARGFTPLFTLVKTKPKNSWEAEARQKIMRRLIEGGADVEARKGSYGPTALHSAAFGCCFESAAMLLENGADVNVSTREGLTPLACAAIKGNLEIVKLFMDHNAKVDTPGVLNTTPLEMVILAQHEFQNKAGNTFWPHILELFLQRKPDLLLQKSERNNFLKGTTITGMAICQGTPEMVKILLRYPGSDVEQGVLRMPLLCWAAFQGKADMVAMLIEQGTSLQGVDGRYGRNALSWAVIKGRQGVFTQLLHTPGVGLDDVDQQGRSALFHAAVAGHEDMFEELRSRGCAVHRPDHSPSCSGSARTGECHSEDP
ncbi:ankyrin repeat domain-containing protein [Aspergillus luchuensis]|uniref:Uncharacterized protein n=1 Tax=Aspergillus kawachii TaxID=1069201 RepID=A0A7R7X190_ASPKA|nr:uncharacterized protein AKAW2_51323A [Aspergillus luchuensis]BCS00982.1 hypothetical protein AKAW2_51323A [Aspergillus luchuensis]BCS12738.1 hypothetical protein ALUC_50784A [Aspergillus luchuensis]GAA82769.1 hypothetical protein AKAW_00884 [Aspergillus luchuensis IFO 4308]